MPKLSDSTKDTYKSFMTQSESAAIHAMAMKAHEEELLSLDQPWWKILEKQEEIEL